MTHTSQPILHVYNMILDHIRYRSGYSGKYLVNSQINQFEYSNGKREYKALISTTDNCIHFGIREDGNTRTVFNGVIYTIDQFFLVDQLTMII